MSKKLIAGAGVVASFAIALAPLATFAEGYEDNSFTSDEHTDHFAITVKDTCAFGHLAVGTQGEDGYVAALTGVSHNTGGTGNYDGLAAWTNDATSGVTRDTGRTPDNANGTPYVETDNAAYSIEAGTTKAGFATTTLTVYCNNSTDTHYNLYVQMADLTKTGGGTIAANAGYSASISGYAIDSVAAGNSNHGAAKNASGEDFNSKFGSTTKTLMASSTTGTDTSGDSYTVTYGLGVASTQEAGTYEGNVVYTLYRAVESN